MMKKKFDRIYIEITNVCNLRCSFCSKGKKVNRVMSVSEFEEVIFKIKDYTDNVYLHVKGEPLIHPHLEEILDICFRYNLCVNITTNGTSVKDKSKLFNKFPNIKKINFSLHSENNSSTYLEDIFRFVRALKNKPIIVYRFWTKFPQKFVDKLKEEYCLSTLLVDKVNNDKNIRIAPYTFVDKDDEFVWPSLDNTYYNEIGFCHGLKSHIAILSDGTVVPCCLDSDGIIELGNIYRDSFDKIVCSDKFKSIVSGFNKRVVTEELCKHCSFKDRF